VVDVRAGALTAGLLLLTLASISIAAPAPRLTLTEDAGVARVAAPVTIGVPLPKGWLRAGESAHLEGSSGALPTQQRVLGQWPDGSARWLLLDFQADLEGRQRREFELQRGAGPASSRKVSVQARGDDVEIDTGAVRLLVGRGSGGFFRVLSLAGKGVQAEPVRGEMTSGGRAWSAEPPAEMVVEERGPLRVAVTLRGRYGNGFGYDVRLEAYAGLGRVRVLHTFVNGLSAATTSLERIRLHLPAPGEGKAAQWSALAVGGEDLGGELGKGARVTQVDAHTLAAAGGPRPGRLSGWFELRGPAFRMGVDAPFFWQEFPQAMEASASGLTYDLWADVAGPAPVGVGAAKTHELLLVYGGGAERGLGPGRGVTAAPNPAWVAASGALWNAVDPGREQRFVAEVAAAFSRYTLSVDSEGWDEAGACAPGGREVRRKGFYGMLNWGDWNFRGYHDTTKDCDAWGNQEYDLTQVLALLFAADGRADVREFLTASARHYAEVDRIHHQPDHPEWVGMNHPKNPQHFTFEFGGVDLGHTWLEGLFTYHFLTGEPRARAAAVGIADYLVRRLGRGIKGNPRQFGWPALALAAAYEATGEARYRDAAIEYAQLGIRAHPVPGKVGKDWKLGILAEGVSYVHAVGGGAALETWLRTYAATVLERRLKDVRYYPGVAYVGRLEKGDSPHARAARAAAGRIVFGDWGKPFTIGGRVGFRILWLLDS